VPLKEGTKSMMNRNQVFLKKIVFNGKLNREKFANNKKKMNVSNSKRQIHTYSRSENGENGENSGYENGENGESSCGENGGRGENGGGGGPNLWFTILAGISVHLVDKSSR